MFEQIKSPFLSITKKYVSSLPPSPLQIYLYPYKVVHISPYRPFQHIFNNPLQQSNLTLSDLANCIVNLLPPSSGGRYLHCMLEISANVSSFYYLLMEVLYSSENISGCIIVLGCHQVRYQNPAVTALFYIPLG